jgi:hypothetical protein
LYAGLQLTVWGELLNKATAHTAELKIAIDEVCDLKASVRAHHQDIDSLRSATLAPARRGIPSLWAQLDAHSISQVKGRRTIRRLLSITVTNDTDPAMRPAINMSASLFAEGVIQNISCHFLPFYKSFVDFIALRY